MSGLISPARDRAAWLAERQSGIGASEAAICLGLAPSRLKLYLSKLDAIEPEPQTDRQRVGLKMEPVIASEYEERTGRKIRVMQRFLRHPDYPWLIATLDAVTECGRVVEFKTADAFGPEGRLVRDEVVPDKWLIQVHQQLTLAGATGEADPTEGDVAAWVNNDLVILPVRRHEPLWRHAADEIEEFWHSHVLAGVPPEESAPGDAAVLTRLYRRQSGEVLTLGDDAEAWAREYQGLSREIRELEQERELRRARLLLAIGNADGAETPGGWSVARKVVTVRNKAREASTSEQVRLTIKAPKDQGGES